MECALHADVEAFHECAHCGAWLCDDCARPVQMPAGSLALPGGRRVLSCARCGGLARQVSKAAPTEAMEARELLRLPFGRDALGVAVAVAVPYWIAALGIPVLGW